MRVKCVLCDDVQQIDSYSLQAKRMRNRRTHTFICQGCHERITDKTNARVATGKFRFNRERKKEKHLP
ncbi:YlaI family protein [Pontibacillus halophilus]|uniref:YlaI family protein n=1 Tax=Pontibacillus halophilus TaxID=516704 RepID=UPI0009DC064E|nr:YlaI family protein [Pontibacillus halophilus]